MTDSAFQAQARLLALALYEIRLLLVGSLGSQNDADISVRQAAHLAYALHNEALAIVEDRQFEPTAAIARLRAVDDMLGSEFFKHFTERLGNGS